MEAAIKKYPPSMTPKERWIAIGNDVNGKTAKKFLERYKFLKEKLKK